MQTAHGTHSITKIFANLRGTAFVGIGYNTVVKTAAKSPLRDMIAKQTSANISVGNNLKDFTDLYLNRVKRTAGDEEKGETFEKSASHFDHTDFYSVVYNENLEEYYLFALFNGTSTTEYRNLHTNTIMTKEQVIEHVTPSTARQMMDETGTVYNKTNDVAHSAIVRTIKLSNLTHIQYGGVLYTGTFTV